MPDSALDRSQPIRLELLARTPREGTARSIAERDLARYYRALSEALATISLSKQEAVVVWEAMQFIWKAKDDGQHAPFESLVESLAAAVKVAAHRLFGYSDTRGVNDPALVARTTGSQPGSQGV